MPRAKPADRWTVSHACREFGLHEETFAKRWRQMDIPPSKKDQMWSSPQIAKIVFGDMSGEKLRLITEQADRIALENTQKRRELVPVDNVLIGGQRFVAAAKSKIMSLKISDQEKDEILQELANLATERVLDVPSS